MQEQLHIAALVRAKQAAIRKGTAQGMMAGAVAVAGAILRHQWPVVGAILVTIGLLVAGWIGRGIWDASQQDTRFKG